jgi:hypothetical protein
MKCERPNCKCGNAEIRTADLYYVQLGGEKLPVPYCQWAIEQMESENAAYPKSPQSKKYLERKKKDR